MSNPTPHIMTASEMGRIGGAKSRRILTPEEAHRIVMIREKQRARSALTNAINRGDVTRPRSCSKCGAPGEIEAHHHNGYKNPLDVQWLCIQCHTAAHPEIERTGRAPLSDEGPSVTYPLRVPESWRGALKRAGAEAVRKRLKPLVSKFAE